MNKKKKITRPIIRKFVQEISLSTFKDKFEELLREELRKYFKLVDNKMKDVITSEFKHRLYLGAAENAYNEYIQSAAYDRADRYKRNIENAKNALDWI